jgi:hypothetical protein
VTFEWVSAVHCCDFMLCRFKRVHIIYQNCMLQKIYSKHGLVEQIQHEFHLATDDAKEQNIYFHVFCRWNKRWKRVVSVEQKFFPKREYFGSLVCGLPGALNSQANSDQFFSSSEVSWKCLQIADNYDFFSVKTQGHASIATLAISNWFPLFLL